MEHKAWVSRYRNELKGLAILWVVFFHSELALGGSWDLLRQLGYGGVDIFFFLMGMGLYHSLQKSEDLRGYASRRLWRILPAYLPILAAWMIVMYPGYQMSTTQTIRSITGNLFMVGFWLQSPSTFNWFVSAQFLFIILAPFCFAFLNRSSKPVLALLMFLGIAGGIGLANIGNEQMMGVSRLPIFILGMAFSMDWPMSRKKGAVRIAYIILFALGLAMVLLCLTRYKELLIDYGMYWYPFALMTPALCVFLSWVLHRAAKVRGVFAPLRWLGQSSFEIYLLNIWMVEVAKKNSLKDTGLWILLCVGNLLAGIGYHWLVEHGTKALHSDRPKQMA